MELLELAQDYGFTLVVAVVLFLWFLRNYRDVVEALKSANKRIDRLEAERLEYVEKRHIEDHQLLERTVVVLESVNQTMQQNTTIISRLLTTCPQCQEGDA